MIVDLANLASLKDLPISLSFLLSDWWAVSDWQYSNYASVGVIAWLVCVEISDDIQDTQKVFHQCGSSHGCLGDPCE